MVEIKQTTDVGRGEDPAGKKRTQLFFNQKPMKRFSMLALLLLFALPAFAQWEPDVRLTYNDSNSATSYNNAWCVAGTGDTVHVVWHDDRDGNPEIYTRRSLDGGSSWSSDTRLTNDSAGSGYSSVAVSGRNVYVVWSDSRDGNEEIYTKRSLDGGATWGQDTRLTSYGEYSLNPSVAALGGNVHVVWRDFRDGNWEIYYKRSTDCGGIWSTDTNLTNDYLYSYSPSVAASGSRVHVVWEDSRDGNEEIYTKRSLDGGATWGPDTNLTNDGADSWYPSVASSGNNVHIVWQDNRYGNFEIYTKRSLDGGATWGPDTRLTNNTAWSQFPSVAASGSNVHVVWRDERDGNYEIYTKRSTDGGTTWCPDMRLTTNSAGSWYPSVSASGSRVHVVWQDNRDGNWEIYYKRNPTGNSGVEMPVGRLKITPNPFTSFATIPGHEAERFSLYDIAGRKVGTYKGDRIGEGLAPGVYFLRPESGEARPLRVVKVR